MAGSLAARQIRLEGDEDRRQLARHEATGEVVGDERDGGVVRAAQVVIARCLDLIGVEAPERM